MEPIRLASKPALQFHIAEYMSGNAPQEVRHLHRIPSDVLPTAVNLCRDQYDCLHCNMYANATCDASVIFHTADYYLQNAHNFSAFWTHLQRNQRNPLSSLGQSFNLLTSNWFSMAEPYSGTKDFDVLRIPQTCSVITPGKCKKGTLATPVWHMERTPSIDFILFDQPILNLLQIHSVNLSPQEDYEFLKGLDPTAQNILQSVLLYWREKHPLTQSSEHQTLEDIFFIHQASNGKGSVPDPIFLFSPVHTKARLLLHLQFLSAKYAQNASVHSSHFHLRRSASMIHRAEKAAGVKIGNHILNRTHIFKLLGEFSPTDQWYYEMCTGLSLTAELACLMYQIEESHPEDKQNPQRIESIYRLLESFRSDIVSCPALFWRIAVLRHIIFLLDASDELLEASDTLKEAFLRHLLRYSNQIAPPMDALPMLPRNRILVSFENYMNFLLQTPEMEVPQKSIYAAINESTSSDSPHLQDTQFQKLLEGDTLLPIFQRAQKLCEEDCRALLPFSEHIPFPFSFCSVKHPHVDRFRALVNSNKMLHKQVEQYFQKIHQILYPNGYEIPKISTT